MHQHLDPSYFLNSIFVTSFFKPFYIFLLS